MALKRETYLDTSSLRSIGRKLPSLKGFGSCYTSAFTLIELLNGIRKNETNFSRRAATLRHITQSHLKIDWALPEAYLTKAFRNFIFQEDRRKSLRAIVEAAVEATNLTSFESRLAELPADYSIEFFEEYDNDFGTDYIEYSNPAYRELKEQYLAYRQQLQETELFKDVLPPSYKEFVNSLRQDDGIWRQLRTATQWGITLKLCAHLEDMPSHEQMLENCASYNGSLDVFIEADCHKMLLDLASTNSVGRNDPADLAHFLYVKKSTLFVSEDNDHRLIAEAIGLKNCSFRDLLPEK